MLVAPPPASRPAPNAPFCTTLPPDPSRGSGVTCNKGVSAQGRPHMSDSASRLGEPDRQGGRHVDRGHPHRPAHGGWALCRVRLAPEREEGLDMRYATLTRIRFPLDLIDRLDAL